jgi:nucleotide-binding universal stress UspA family protein
MDGFRSVFNDWPPSCAARPLPHPDPEATDMSDIKCILVPHDYGDTSAAAADYALRLAGLFDAEVWFLHIGELPAVNDYLSSQLELDGVAADDVRLHVEGGRTANADRLARTRYFARTGNPAAEITRFAAENDVDLIVMGTHGRAGFAHVVLGSVAERVVRTATCPVLTVRRPLAAYAVAVTANSRAEAPSAGV